MTEKNIEGANKRVNDMLLTKVSRRSTMHIYLMLQDSSGFNRRIIQKQQKKDSSAL